MKKAIASGAIGVLAAPALGDAVMGRARLRRIAAAEAKRARKAGQRADQSKV